MEIEYELCWRVASSLEDLKEADWTRHICFAFLRDIGKNTPFLEIEFKNRLDNWKHVHKNGGTSEWLVEFDLSDTDAENGIAETRVEEDYYYVTLDLSVLSYEWAFSILTLYRYPGEYYNICWNYWEIKKKYPDCSTWEALYLAHQGTWESYSDIFPSFYYYIGHSLFKNGHLFEEVDVQRIFKRLSLGALFPYINKKSTPIHFVWGGAGYASYLNFDIALPEGWNYELSSS